MLKISKLHENIITPTRGTEGSAGLDIYAPCNFYIGANRDIMVGTGLKVAIPKGYMLQIMNRSSVARRRVVVGACVIDSDYQGQVIVHLINLNPYPESFSIGERIAQMVLTPVGLEEPFVVDEKDLFSENTKRGEGGFGSTGL